MPDLLILLGALRSDDRGDAGGRKLKRDVAH